MYFDSERKRGKSKRERVQKPKKLYEPGIISSILGEIDPYLMQIYPQIMGVQNDINWKFTSNRS